MSKKHHKDAGRQLRAIADQIRARRVELGLTQETLAEGLDVSVETIKHIEGERGWISLRMLFHICKKMNIKITIG